MSTTQGAPGAATSAGSVNDADGMPRRHPAALAKAEQDRRRLAAATQPPNSVTLGGHGGVPLFGPMSEIRTQGSSHGAAHRVAPDGRRVEVTKPNGLPTTLEMAEESDIVTIYDADGRRISQDPISSLRLTNEIVNDENGRPGLAATD